jgi:DNA (cytosine-5)-methyltransferase 1
MNHVDTTSPITHISLCAGYGGIDIGLARAIPNLRTIAFSEIEAFACANLVSKMEAGLLDCAPIWTDLKTFPWDEFRGKVDIISGGFPCQPFSCAGKRDGDEDPRHLFPYILDGIGRCRPSIVFLENVEGILSAKLNGDGWRDPAGTPVLLHVLRELERVGYKATAGVFSASEVGAPHQRKRVFIMAHRDSNGSSARIPRQEQGHEGSTRIANDSSGQVWPSRSGQSQYEWEPPRVVGNANGLEGRGASKIPRIQGEWAADSIRFESASETNMVNPECIRLQGWRDEGSMGETSEIPAREGSESAQADKVSSSSREREGCWADASERNEVEPPMGGNPDGSSRGMGYAELSVSCDNRTDELRLLGNGVCPPTASLAWITLLEQLTNTQQCNQ